MNKQEHAAKRDKIQKLGHIQNEGKGDHIAINHSIQEELNLKLAKEEMKWNQRAKKHWLKLGDRNTKFYHMHANQREKTNRISWVQAPNGTMIMVQDQIGDFL